MSKNSKTSCGHIYDFCLEWRRLASFAKFPVNGPSAIALARSGFYYLDEDDRTRCFSCDVTYRTWKLRDVPNEVHARISPKCRHVNGCDPRNIPIMSENTKTDINAGKTSKTAECSTKCGGPRHLPEGDHHSSDSNFLSHQESSSLSQASINDIGATNKDILVESLNDDHAQMTSTRLKVEGTLIPEPSNGFSSTSPNTGENVQEKEKDTDKVTVREPLNGYHRQATDTHNASKPEIDNVSLTRPFCPNNLFDGAVLVSAQPRYPEYAIKVKRTQTFDSWTKSQSAELLAMAGFFRADDLTDLVRCFFCGGGLKSWENGDNPWIEHAKWFPRCQFVRQNMGDSLVSQAKSMRRDKNRPESLKGSEAVYSSIEERLRSMKLMPSSPTPGSPKGDPDVADKEIDRLLEERKALLTKKMCRVCEEKESCVILLPCGHVPCCAACGVATPKCPICQKTVESVLRLFWP